MCLNQKKHLQLSRAVYKGFRADSQKWFPEDQNSTGRLQQFRASSQKSCSEVSKTKKCV